MFNFRDQKRQAREQLHATLADMVLYIPGKGMEPVTTTVRLHISFNELGELRRSGFGEREELTPRAIFLKESQVPSRGAVIVTADLGVFLIEQTDPPDDLTIKTRISRLPAGQYALWGLTFNSPWAGLPAPTV